MRALNVWLNDDQVGTITEDNDIWQFEYDSAWAAKPNTFDLAPGLPRAKGLIADGSSTRPVQWYFDNLLPEETLREVLTKEAKLKGDDAFALLEYLGLESAGSLVLLPPGAVPAMGGGLQPLSFEEINRRITIMGHVPLGSAAPKRMSLAGAQHKLAVVLKDGELFEPIGNEPSTHILKPNHTSSDYAASAALEFVTMRLAARLGLAVPAVHLLYTPEPAYIVARFDRCQDSSGTTVRNHIIDTCQLLGKSRTFKQNAATTTTLLEAAGCTNNRIESRLRIFEWLLFCTLVGNDDNHLKNLSFRVGADEIHLAPHYDLIATGVYHTKALANENGKWPEVPMMYSLGAAESFGAVRNASLGMVSVQFGMGHGVVRIIEKMTSSILRELDVVLDEYSAASAQALPHFTAQENTVLKALRHIVIPEMIAKINS